MFFFNEFLVNIDLYVKPTTCTCTWSIVFWFFHPFCFSFFNTACCLLNWKCLYCAKVSMKMICSFIRSCMNHQLLDVHVHYTHMFSTVESWFFYYMYLGCKWCACTCMMHHYSLRRQLQGKSYFLVITCTCLCERSGMCKCCLYEISRLY